MILENGERVLAVQRMQDFIAERIDEPVSLYMLSEVAGYSPWHTLRIFRQLTGKTPLEYIRYLRLSRAAVKLAGGERIVDVALDFAFDTHEGFTRAFSSAFGMTPSEYRRDPRPIKLFMPVRIKDYYLKLRKGEIEMGEKANTVFVQVVERPKRKFILKRGVKAENYYDYCGEVGCDVWGELCSIKGALYEPVGVWLPEAFRKKGTSEYAQGVEMPADYNGEVPEGYEMIELPACKMMVFQSPPFKDEDFEEAISDIWEIMKNYDPQMYGFRWADEDGPRFQMEPLGERGYIEGRPVRPL
jgi:AraC family transcriptional regulator